jgi:hypothetical protein
MAIVVIKVARQINLRALNSPPTIMLCSALGSGLSLPAVLGYGSSQLFGGGFASPGLALQDCTARWLIPLVNDRF